MRKGPPQQGLYRRGVPISWPIPPIVFVGGVDWSKDLSVWLAGPATYMSIFFAYFQLPNYYKALIYKDSSNLHYGVKLRYFNAPGKGTTRLDIIQV